MEKEFYPENIESAVRSGVSWRFSQREHSSVAKVDLISLIWDI